MFYSASENRFYDPVFKSRYETAGAWPDDAIEVTEDEWQTYGAGEPPAGKVRGATAEGRPTWADTPPVEMTLEDLADRQCVVIAAALTDALTAGMPYTMPDGSEDTVQMLAEDRQNLLGLAIEARDFQAAGEIGAVQEFRAKSNTRYPMTPDQTIALTDAALSHYKVLKARSWDRKDAIDAALEAGDREGIEAVVW